MRCDTDRMPTWLNLATELHGRQGKTMANIDGDILTLDEVAVYLKAGKRTVYRLATNGQIPAFKLGGTWRFRRSELDRWIDDQTGQNRNQSPKADQAR